MSSKPGESSAASREERAWRQYARLPSLAYSLSSGNPNPTLRFGRVTGREIHARCLVLLPAGGEHMIDRWLNSRMLLR